jgi:acetoin utilization protein AcuB
LGDAHEAMKRTGIRHLPVTKNDRLIGILSERDILAVRARVDHGDWWMVPVERAMKAPAQTAGLDDSLTEVAGRMAASKIGAMPIVEHGKLLGIATVTDVLDAEVQSAMAPSSRNGATAADAMTAYPLTISPDMTLADAAVLMVRRHVRHLPVVDNTSKIIGMLSERDVRRAIGDPVHYIETRRRLLSPTRVRDVMTSPAIVTPYDRPLVEIAMQFADDKLGALPIVDKFGALIGIVSYVDALRLLAAA